MVQRQICDREAIFWMIKSNTDYQYVVSKRGDFCLILVSPTFNSRLSVSFNLFRALINMCVVLSKLLGNLFLLLQFKICNRSVEISSFILFLSPLLVCFQSLRVRLAPLNRFKPSSKIFY